MIVRNFKSFYANTNKNKLKFVEEKTLGTVGSLN